MARVAHKMGLPPAHPVVYFRSYMRWRVLLFILASTPCLWAGTPVVVQLTTAEHAKVADALEVLQAKGIRGDVHFGNGVWLGWAAEPVTARSLGGLGHLYTGPVDRRGSRHAEPELDLALAYLAARSGGMFDKPAAQAHMDWSGYDCSRGSKGLRDDEDEDAPEPPDHDWACGSAGNSERLMGTVLATTIFVESNGTVDPDRYTWTATAVQEVKLSVIDAWAIWIATAADHGVQLSVEMNWVLPWDPVASQGYEPIMHRSSDDQAWIGAIMANAGHTAGSAMDRLHAFNAQQRQRTGTDHAFTAFYAYNPSAEGAPVNFVDGKIGYAILGGPYMHLLYKANGWAVEQNNRIYGHELAHVFHAFDEYWGAGAANCSRSFNGRRNLNFHGDQCNGSAACVMVDNAFAGTGAARRWALCAHTPVHLGWGHVLPEPQLLAPLPDELLEESVVSFEWAVEGELPEHLEQWLRVHDADDVPVLCQRVDGVRDWTAQLPNGDYSWWVSHGEPVPTNGYAGVISSERRFRVQAELRANMERDHAVICPGGSVQWSDRSSGGATSWRWTFPGGIPDRYVGRVPPAVVYPVPGTYGVGLWISDGTNSDSLFHAMAVRVGDIQAMPYAGPVAGASVEAVGWDVPYLHGYPGWQLVEQEVCDADLPVFRSRPTDDPNAWRTLRLVSPLIDPADASVPWLRFRYAHHAAAELSNVALLVNLGDCDGGLETNLLELSGDMLVTATGTASGPEWVPGCADWRTYTLPLPTDLPTPFRITFDLMIRGAAPVWLESIELFDGMVLDLRMLLGGAFRSGTMPMRDDLRAAGLLPVDEPYAARGYAVEHVSAQTGLLARTGPQAVVDWVVVMLRDKDQPAEILHQWAMLLQADGRVIDPATGAMPRLPVEHGEYHVSVHHRNHLGVVTMHPERLDGTPRRVDFAAPGTAVRGGVSARMYSEGVTMLWTGNANGDGKLRYIGPDNDRDAILQRIGGVSPTATEFGYFDEDVNMDGSVSYLGVNNDRDHLIRVLGRSVNHEVQEQLP